MRKKIFALVLIMMFAMGIALLLKPQRETLNTEKRAANKASDIVFDSEITNKVNSVLEDQMFKREIIINKYYSIKNLLAKPFGKASNADVEVISKDVVSVGDGYLVSNIFETDWEEALNTATGRGYNLKYISDMYPDIKTYVYYPTRIEDTNLLDTNTLDSRVDEIESAFIRELGDNIKFRKLEINTIEDYKKYYFKTDHHWNIDGAYQGYSDIINMIGEDFEIDEPREIVNRIDYGYDFYGTFARKIGNAVEECDHISDYNLGIASDDYDCYYDGVERDVNKMKKVYEDNGLPSFADGMDDYEIYFDFGCLERRFEFHQEDKPNILIFADSFVCPIKDWLASHFNTTIILDMRDAGEDFNLNDYIEKYNIDIMLNLEYYDSLYFSGFFFIPVDYK